MTENDYLLAWGAYAVAALGCLLVWWRMTRWTWRYLREPLGVIVAVLLFSPTIVDPNKELFAPAIAVTALDLLFKVGNNAWRAVADLALYGMIALGLYLLLAAIRWPFERAGRARQAKREASRDTRTLRQRMAEDSEDFPADAFDAVQPASRRGGRERLEPRL
jgi:hypothetical protein